SAAGLIQSKLWKSGTLCITIAANIADTAILSFDACFPDSIIGFIPDPKKSDPRYIKYLFDTVLQKRFKRFTQGAAQDNLSQEKLLSLKLPVVEDVNDQRVIADKIAIYDDLIDTNRRRIQLLEEAARLLFREWFVYFRFPGHEKVHPVRKFDSNGVKIVGGVPEGWKKEHLSKLVSTQYGYTETASQEEIGPKFLRGKDINKTSYIDWSSVPYCSNKKLDFRKYSLSRGDILIVRMADPGKVGIVEVEIEAIFASYLVRLKVINKSISSYYLFYSLLNDKYQGFITGSSTGSTRKSASAKLLVDYYLLIPKKEIIDSFGEQIIPIRKDITILLQQNQKLARARDLLLPRLMSGAIEI
ncbi:restriction endonuclease subunit S, partial [Patescibacteria group bacterium]|nr:restriction endonuclease subunit S [Patescibacteria group bacterium]